MDEVIFFELNNWFAGSDYPDCGPFLTWMKDDLHIPFSNNGWCIQNKICVIFEMIDMSQNFKITATRSWIEENCPCILTNKYAKFICNLDVSKYDTNCTEYDEQFRYGYGPFLKYCESNFGSHFYEVDTVPV